jgi:copper resistance protein D
MIAVVAALVHGLWHVAVAVLVGGLVVDLLILGATTEDVSRARARLRRWISGSLVVLALVSGADLLVRAQAMSGTLAARGIAVVPDVVSRTHFGAVWLTRAGLLALAFALSLRRDRASRSLALATALAIVATRNVSGHAGEWGDLTVSVGADWAHAVAASAWTGGLITLAFVVPGRALPSVESLGRLGRRFSRLAAGCVVVVLVTGIYNAWTQLGPLSALWTTTYGRTLVVKVIGVAGLVALGAITRYVVLPRLQAAPGTRGVGERFARVARLALVGRAGVSRSAAASRFSEYVTAEALLALGVFACTAALGEATPGRHAVQEARASIAHVPTSSLLRRSPEVAGGTVIPPPGDAARGRAVFARLACFTCHAVRDGGFAPPRQPGPDLSGIGRRHPGYLVESILNPNAMIVDGPGYMDASGLSTMPDYRDRLTVRELIDLVTYLRRL